MNDKEIVKKCKEYYKEVKWNIGFGRYILKNYWKMYRDYLFKERERWMIRCYVLPTKRFNKRYLKNREKG